MVYSAPQLEEITLSPLVQDELFDYVENCIKRLARLDCSQDREHAVRQLWRCHGMIEMLERVHGGALYETQVLEHRTVAAYGLALDGKWPTLELVLKWDRLEQEAWFGANASLAKINALHDGGIGRV